MTLIDLVCRIAPICIGSRHEALEEAQDGRRVEVRAEGPVHLDATRIYLTRQLPTTQSQHASQDGPLPAVLGAIKGILYLELLWAPSLQRGRFAGQRLSERQELLELRPQHLGLFHPLIPVHPAAPAPSSER
jgi:hypothetical protein